MTKIKRVIRDIFNKFKPATFKAIYEAGAAAIEVGVGSVLIITAIAIVNQEAFDELSSSKKIDTAAAISTASLSVNTKVVAVDPSTGEIIEPTETSLSPIWDEIRTNLTSNGYADRYEYCSPYYKMRKRNPDCSGAFVIADFIRDQSSVTCKDNIVGMDAECRALLQNYMTETGECSVRALCQHKLEANNPQYALLVLDTTFKAGPINVISVGGAGTTGGGNSQQPPIVSKPPADVLDPPSNGGNNEPKNPGDILDPSDTQLGDNQHSAGDIVVGEL